MFKLRPSFIASFLLITFCSTALHAQAPYEAITTARVNVRSGPDEKHYTTARLEPETRVTVLREENGWLAIEPPEGSFSWIAGEYVREISSAEGEVTGDGVLARIGTPTDKRKRDDWQKKLKRGDRVKILEKSTSGEGKLTSIWYKIAPPPGEVRYVNAQFVQPVSGRRSTNPRPTSNKAESSDRPHAPRDLGTEANTPDPGRPVPMDLSQGNDETDDVPPRAASRGTHSALERANAAYQDMMQRPIAERNIAAVRQLYEAAAQSATGVGEHGFIADRLEALQSQEERKAKLMEFDRAIRRSRQRDEAILSIPRKKGKDESDDTSEAQAETSPRYDASGTLRRSTAIIDGKPAYVLLSPQGGIRYYVTPSPGTDFTKYLDRVVAVRGPSAYRVEVRAQHITVRDITVIELNESSYREAKPGRGTRRL